MENLLTSLAYITDRYCTAGDCYYYFCLSGNELFRIIHALWVDDSDFRHLQRHCCNE